MNESVLEGVYRNENGVVTGQRADHFRAGGTSVMTDARRTIVHLPAFTVCVRHVSVVAGRAAVRGSGRGRCRLRIERRPALASRAAA